MRKNAILLAAAAFTFFANACGRDTGVLPTDVVSATKVTASSVTCASYSQIVALAEIVFAPSASEVTGKLSAIKLQLDNNNPSNARSKGMTLIAFILKKNAQHQVAGTQAQVTQLVNDIMCWLGITGSIPSAADAFVINPGGTQSDTIVNAQGNAGVILPAGSVSEPTIITIAPIPFTSTGPGSGPLLTKLDQYPGYFDISKISETNAPLLQPVVVAVCPAATVSVSIRQTLRLGHQATSGFELTPPANANFLSCPVTAAAVMGPAVTASAQSTRVKTRNLGFDLSATGGVGGTTGTFSPFGTVDGTLTATGGVGGTTGTFIRMGEMQASVMFDGRPYLVAPCSQATPGSAVPTECRPTVSITTARGTILQSVPVSFAITQGGGSVAAQTLSGCGAFSSSVTVTTSNFGLAIACWKLGAAAGMNSVTATPSPGGDVPPSAVFSPSTLVFNMNGVVGDNTPPVISDPVITGTKGLDDWYTSNVSVSWQVTDPESAFTTTGCSASLTSDNAGVTYTCSATNAVGLTSSRSITLKRDASIPTGSVSVTGEKGIDDWFISNVAVNWTLTPHGPSLMGASTGCADAVVSSDGNFSFTCTPKSGAGLSGANITAAGRRDASIPTVSVAVGGTKGNDDWFITDVTIAWTTTAHGPSGLGSAVGCNNEVINADGNFSRDCTVVSGAGVSSGTLTTSGKRDASIPTVSVVIGGTKGTNDWFVTDVNIAWTLAAHGPSGLGAADGCVNAVINSDGTFSGSCKVVSGAGLPSETVTASGKRDATKPIVTYSGNLGSYGVDAFVAITCSASDVTSGVASTTCAGAEGAAYNFNVGQNSLWATAIDFAGNVGSGSTSFTVILTSSNLCTLTRRFSRTTGVANSLCSKLENIAKAGARGDANAKAGMVTAFINEVSAQTGKALSSADAAVLVRLVRLL